jgi:hypothetical protein
VSVVGAKADPRPETCMADCAGRNSKPPGFVPETRRAAHTRQCGGPSFLAFDQPALSEAARNSGCCRQTGRGIDARVSVLVLQLCTDCPQASGNRPSTKREPRRGISAARHTAPAEGVPSLTSALVKCRTARINYGNNGAF